MRKKGATYYFSKAAQGILLSLVVLAFIFIFNRDALLAELCLYETMPSYEMGSGAKMLFKLAPEEELQYVLESEQPEVIPVFEASSIEAADLHIDGGGLIGMDDVIFQPETHYSENHFGKENLTIDDLEGLRDLKNLKSRFYVVNERTDITPDLFNIDEFLSQDLTIDNSVEGPKVLIFHTHSNECYADSNGAEQGVVGVGEALARTLTEEYGIETLHNSTSFDIINGESHVLGSYERMEPVITKILTDNPSIQVVIDIHRDGVPEDTRLTEVIDGEPTAQIMFVNGLSRLYQDGQLNELDSLPNLNLPSNLAFSFRAQLAANELYPGFTRKVYLNAYRYSLHMAPKSLLIEVGAQTNTEEEAQNAVAPLAKILAETLLPM